MVELGGRCFCRDVGGSKPSFPSFFFLFASFISLVIRCVCSSWSSNDLLNPSLTQQDQKMARLMVKVIPFESAGPFMIMVSERKEKEGRMNLGERKEDPRGEGGRRR